MHKFEKRDAKSRTLVILAVVGLAAAITVGIFTAVRMLRKPPASKDDPKTGIVYDDSAVEGGWDNLSPEEIAEKLNEKVAEGMINISMNTAPYFENGTAEGNVMIVNEDINLYRALRGLLRHAERGRLYAGELAGLPLGAGRRAEHCKGSRHVHHYHGRGRGGSPVAGVQQSPRSVFRSRSGEGADHSARFAER